MNAPILREQTIIKLAILAIGGQGGGVIADWIVDLAEKNGWYAQSTSVPGVAQRTGATIYYIEMVPETGMTPVLSLMPAPGDVDIVIAAEFMEAGRAIMRGLVTPDRTTLITSTHRAYAVSEKAAPGEAIADAGKVRAAAEQMSRRFIASDMEKIAAAHGSVISASLFGALAASKCLPFSKESFEQTIKSGGKGMEASLRAFTDGFSAVAHPQATPEAAPAKTAPQLGGPSALKTEHDVLATRIEQKFPATVHDIAKAGLAKVVDFQDVAYGREYLDRLAAILGVDLKAMSFELTRETAKYLANAMCYDDILRVADLKSRGSRFERVRREVGVKDDQVLALTEYFHPRMQEVCGTLPAGLGRWIETHPKLFTALDRMINRGRRFRSDGVFSFGTLYMLGGLRRYRRKLLRHEIEHAHREAWLAQAERLAPINYDLAVEVIRCRRLIKGYSDTHARGQTKFDRVLSALPLLEQRKDGADWLRRLREAALLDEAGTALDGTLKTIASLSP
jgi:indolepyruvate ferredoxin oxidoreductase, beta subunit